ncbi:MAG: hypothetical protein WCV84_04670 [Patescibacteria group bacterium]
MEQKYWLDSSTVRASLLQMLPVMVLVLKMFGIEIGDGETQSIVEGITAIVSLVGVVYAIVGRAKADKPLTFTK